MSGIQSPKLYINFLWTQNGHIPLVNVLLLSANTCPQRDSNSCYRLEKPIGYTEIREKSAKSTKIIFYFMRETLDVGTFWSHLVRDVFCYQ
jgi:hypothetical protein